MVAKALSIMRYQEDINTEHNMKSVCRATLLLCKLMYNEYSDLLVTVNSL